MVIALFALSLVMILGGAAAVVQGFPYVRLESGLVMVTGGATAASAGAIVLGIAVALVEVKKLLAAIGQRGTSAPAPASVIDQDAIAPALQTPAFETAPPLSTVPAAITAGTAGLAGVQLGSARDLLGDGDRAPAVDPVPSRAHEIEPPLPGLIPPAVPSAVPPPAPGEPISVEDDLFVLPEDLREPPPSASIEEPKQPDPAQEELALRPALEEPAPEPATELDLPAAEKPTETAEEPAKADGEPKIEGLQVVGTYSSGANTYVMFANGTIQADTPRGRFTFQSLDELKEFVDSGGETSARGAA